MSGTRSYAAGPSEPALRDITLGELLREAAEAAPDRPAIIDGHPDPARRAQWTYAELHAEAIRAARAIAARFRPGERLVIWAPNSPRWIITEFGAAMAGVILVTVNPSLQAGELAYVLKQSGAAGLLVVPDYRGNPMLEIARSVRAQCPALRQIIRLDRWEEFLYVPDDRRVSLPDVRPDDAVMIQYTSGTTGRPKGALLHHRGLVNNGTHTMDLMGVPAGVTTLTVMPLFHTSGCVLAVIGAVSRGATQVVVETFDPGLVLELTETFRAYALNGVPTMLIAMLEHPTFGSRDLSSVNAVCSGGATVPAALVERFERELGAPFVIVFGQTELSPVAAMTLPADSIADKAETLGRPMPHVEVKIVDVGTGEIVPTGEVGEFCARGYLQMHGYYEMPEATAETIDADGWLHTGDLCSMDERGYCRIEGRLKDMIIRGGENLYPREIEEALHRHPAVGDVAVVGLPDQRWGEVVGAFVRPAPGAELDREMLFDYLRTELSPQKTPSHWYRLEEFPLTGSGKIRKFRLRELWEAGELEELT